MAGDGDLLPVSALPVDGTFPTGTAQYEKRAIAQEIPIWDPDDLHRLRQVRHRLPARDDPDEGVPDRRRVDGAPADFLHKEFRSQDLAGHRLTIQVAPDDCTGCGVCVDVCPAKSKTEVGHKAINMEPVADHRDVERRALGLLPVDPAARPRACSRTTRSRARQVLEPLFEFSGACAGCGETPYIQLVSQLFGDRMIVANATGCSSIYGANLPTTPWTVERRRPRPGLEQLAVRGQRRVRPRDAARARRPDRPGRASCSSGSPRSSATDLVGELLDAAQDDRGRDRRPARAGRPRCATRSPTSTAPRGVRRATPARPRRRPRPPGRLDHRRRRLGLRHRLRRPRPRPVVRPQRQHPRARHRGLLEHRRPGVEGDPARRRRQVRGRRQGDRQEGPRRDRPRLRQRLRRPGLDGRQRPADDQGAARGRRLAGPVARHRLQHLHRPRHRHVASR